MGLTKPKIVGGVSLPDLTDPAGASDILTGKEAIAEDGAILTGNHVCKQLHELFPALSNPAGAVDVASGKQFVDSAGAVVVGELSALTLPESVPETFTNDTEVTTTQSIATGTKTWRTVVSTDIGDAKNFIFVFAPHRDGARYIFTETEKVLEYSEKVLTTTYTYKYKLTLSDGTLTLVAMHSESSSVSVSKKYYCIIIIDFRTNVLCLKLNRCHDGMVEMKQAT